MDTSEERRLKVEIITLGCKVNQAESRDMAIGLEALGHLVAERWENPDVTIINTCAVTSVSEAKGRKEIGRARRRGTGRLVVTGCMAEVSEAEVAALPGVDEVVPRRGKAGLVDMFRPGSGDVTGGSVAAGMEKARAFVKVQDGCERWCAYCIVPRARGGPVSLTVPEVTGKVSFFLKKGVREIVLCGINLGGWRGEDGRGLAELAGGVLALGEGFRLRLSSVDLEDLDAVMLDGLYALDRLCPHFHLPLQSGSDAVLAAMGRGYTADDYRRGVEGIRSRWDSPAITTDVMVGFPGETDEDFRATMALVEEVRPSRLHVFRYSRRPGTRAAGMSGQLPDGVKRRRGAELQSLGRSLAGDYARAQVGKVLEVLVEKMETGSGGPRALGTTENYLRARVAGAGLEEGGLLRAAVKGFDGTALIMEA